MLGGEEGGDAAEAEPAADLDLGLTKKKKKKKPKVRHDMHVWSVHAVSLPPAVSKAPSARSMKP